MKSKYSELDRHLIYEKVLQLLNSGKHGNFVCLILNDIIGYDEHVDGKFCKKHFPEIWLCRNIRASSYVFLDLGLPYSVQNYYKRREQRELMLMFAMEMTR